MKIAMKGFILMADVVHSGKKPAEKLMKNFKAVVESVNQSCKSGILSPITITLGDEFQGIVKDLKSGISAILRMEEEIVASGRKFQLRYVLYEGEIGTAINPERAHEMLGPGLTNARKTLENSKKARNRFRIAVGNKELSERLSKLFFLLQHFIDNWYEKDIAVVNDFLKGMDYKAIAKKLNKDISTLWRKQKSLSIEEYFVCKTLIKEISNG